MFDALEDIPTEKLVAELIRRANDEDTRKNWRVWPNSDPNNYFTVKGHNVFDAALVAMGDHLDWSIAATPMSKDEELAEFGESDA